MKKRLSWKLLILALLLMLTVFSVAAADTQQAPEVTHATIPIQINPMYEDLYENTVILHAPTLNQSDEFTAPLLNATYVTEDKAVQQIRSNLKSWSEKFTIYVKSENSNYEELFTDLFIRALDHTGDPEEGDYLMFHYESLGGEVSRIDNGSTYDYTFTFYMTYYTTAAQEKELDTAISNLIKTLNVSSKSDYQKVCAVYDYICDNITYDYDHLEDTSYMLQFTAYAALVNKKAVCQGYASLMYRLLLELDVDTRVIAGESLDGVGHAWNIAKLGSVYYNLDATWDAGLSEYNYFLKNSDGFLDHLRYLEYCSTQFHTTYPMSATDYVDGVAGKPEQVYIWGACGNDAYWEIDRDKVLTIYGTGEIYDFESAIHGDLSTWSPWTYWMDGFTKVVIESGITGIGDYSFDTMPNITSVSLPNTLTTIGCNAFYKTNLTSITLPSSLKEIQSDAFYNCAKLTKIAIPNQVTYIGYNAFAECHALKELSLGSSVSHIAYQAFSRTAITSVVIPNSVTQLDQKVFYECQNLKSVTLSNSMTAIPGYTFEGCSALTSITIPESITYIGEKSFKNCTSLPEITFPASLEDLDGFEGCTSLKKITFLGDAPIMAYYGFYNVTATVYYPGTPSWTEDVRQNYGGNLTWVSYHTHDYTDVLPVFNASNNTHSWTCTSCGEPKTESCSMECIILKEATLEAPGVRKFTCSICDGTYQEEYMPRIAGNDRIATALAVATELKEVLGVDKFDAIIIAAGGTGSDKTKFADALSGSYLASVKKAPILLYTKGALADANLEFIQKNLSANGTIYLLGGEAAVPAEVEAALSGYAVKRLKGNDRYETNRVILNEVGLDNADEILIATGTNFADCLSASATGLPIMLVKGTNTELNAQQIEFLNGLKYKKFTILGGEAAVSAELEAAIEAVIGADVERIKGEKREETSTLIAKKYFATADYALIAYSKNYPDGLAGGVLANALGAPLLLSNAGNEKYASAYIEEIGIEGGYILGGTAAVTDDTAKIIFGLT